MTETDAWDSDKDSNNGPTNCLACCLSKTTKRKENIKNKANKTSCTTCRSSRQPKTSTRLRGLETTCASTRSSANNITQDTPSSKTDTTGKQVKKTKTNNIPNANTKSITS